VIGDGEPLLLIPGLGATCRVWDPVVPLLAEHFSLVLVDNRDIGLSKGRRRARTLADYSTDLIELLDVLRLDRAHVLGLSLGGIIAQRFAVDHPTRVDRLVLISCTDHFSPYLLRMAALLGHSLRRFPRAVFHQTMETLGTAPLYLDENVEQIDRIMQEKCQHPIPAMAMGNQLRALLRSEMAPEEYRITAPSLVMAGEHDCLIPSCYARMMSDKIPGSRFVLLRGAGHNPLMECPDMVAPLIVRFLRNQERDELDARDTVDVTPVSLRNDSQPRNKPAGEELLSTMKMKTTKTTTPTPTLTPTATLTSNRRHS
jgi:pimeloyl-ACP methyl ester carboxylesterase